jgi:hypothetical protein
VTDDKPRTYEDHQVRYYAIWAAHRCALAVTVREYPQHKAAEDAATAAEEWFAKTAEPL